MTVRVFDTRSRKKRELVTLEDGKVGLYACGITPYSPSHIGHARQAISFDIIVRWLRKRNFEVNYITNFTDVDDKIIAAANEEGVDFLEISNRYIGDYFESMDALNVIRADAYPRVTETIPEIIEMVESLIEKGNAYLAEDGVYFEIDTSPEKYGQLTGQTLEMVRSGAGGRVDKTGSGRGIIETSLCGRWRSLESLHGRVLGEREGQVGILSALRCLSLIHISEPTRPY